jgi:hypothetical protein
MGLACHKQSGQCIAGLWALLLAATHSLLTATVVLRTAVVLSGNWAQGQVLDAFRGCSSRSYLCGLVTASPATGELWGGCQNRLPHPLAGSFLWSEVLVARSCPL